MKHAPAWLHAAHRWMTAHRLATLALFALAMAGMGLLASRTHVDSDMAQLLPGGPGSPREAAQLLSEFGALDTLVLDLELEGGTTDQLIDAGAALTRRLRESGFFKEVYAGPTADDLMKLGTALMPKRLYLLDQPRDELERRLAAADLPQRLEAVKAQLVTPQAMGMKQALLGDPLQLNTSLLSGLSNAGGGKLEYVRGHLLSADKRHLMLVATPKASALAVNESQALLDHLARERLLLPRGAKLLWVGGPRFAAESAATVRGDIVFNFVTSGLALLVIFVWRFRSVRLLVLGTLPLGVGIVAGIAVVGTVRGTIHGLSLGFGAALVGIAIDYPLHLINRSTEETSAPAERYATALDDVWASVWLGWGTTIVAFAAMFFSRFPGLRELALFASAGVTASFVTTLVLVPPLGAVWGGQKAVRAKNSASLGRLALPRWPAVGVTLTLVVLSLFLSRRLGFDGELRNLDAQSPQTLAEHQLVLERFGQESAGSLVVVEGNDVEEALEAADAVAAALRRIPTVSALRSVSEFVPSKATQLARGKSLAALDLAQAREVLAKAAEAAGFSAHAFEAFFTEIEQARSGTLAPVEPKDLDGTSLAPLLERALRCAPNGHCRVVTAFQRGETPPDVLRAQLPPQATFVDAAALAAQTVAEIPRQLLWLCGIGLLANLLMLWAAYRSLLEATLVVLPCMLGLLCTVAVLAATDTPLNLVSASALVLVLGCGVDYSIFVLQGLRGAAPSGVEAMGVLLAACTTLAGFGTLAYGSHRALMSLGVGVGLGILFSALASLLLLPGLYAALPKRLRAP